MALSLAIGGEEFKDVKVKVSSTDSTTNFLGSKLVEGANITIDTLTGGGGEQTLRIAASAAGETNTMSNVGAGVGVFKAKVGVDFELKSITGVGGITINSNANDVEIDGSGITGDNGMFGIVNDAGTWAVTSFTLGGVTTTTMATDNWTFGSTGNSNLLQLDATADRIGVNIAAPAAKLHVKGEDDLAAVVGLLVQGATNTNLLNVRNANIIGFGLAPDAARNGRMQISCPVAQNVAVTVYDGIATNLNNRFEINVNAGGGAVRLFSSAAVQRVKFDAADAGISTIDTTGDFVIGSATGAFKLDVTAADNNLMRFRRSDASVALDLNLSSGEPSFRLFDSAGPTATVVFRTSGDSFFNGGNVGIGNATPPASNLLDLVSTTAALVVSRMTTTERNALTAVNGMIIYNTTTNAFNFREAAAWVSGSGLA